MFSIRNAVPNIAPTWNLPPSQPALVVRYNPKSGERHLDLLHWGLLPHFERDPTHARMLNNARAETVAKLPRASAAPSRPAVASYQPTRSTSGSTGAS